MHVNTCILFSPPQVIGLTTCNEYSVWRLGRDYCSDESRRSAEYKLGSTAYYRERNRKRDVEQRQSKGEKRQRLHLHMMNRILYLIQSNRNTTLEKNINRPTEE